MSIAFRAPDREPSLSTKEVVHAMDVTPRAIQWWVEKQHVRINRMMGKKRAPRRFRLAQLLRVAVISELRRRHVKLCATAAIVRRVERSGSGARYLLTDGVQTHTFAEDVESAIDILARAKTGLVLIDLHELRLRCAKAFDQKRPCPA